MKVLVVNGLRKITAHTSKDSSETCKKQTNRKKPQHPTPTKYDSHRTFKGGVRK